MRADGAARVGHLDGDTAISAGTFGAALAAAGAVCRAVDRVVAGEVRAATNCVRRVCSVVNAILIRHASRV